MATQYARPSDHGVEGDRGPVLGRPWITWLAVFAVALTIYVITCAPDVFAGDSATFQYRAVRFPSVWEGGYWPDAIVHLRLLYLAVGKLFTWLPAGSLAYRVNLVSALFGAATLANVFASVQLITGSRWAASIAAISLGLGHAFWAFSVVAECLTLVTAGLPGDLLALLVFARTGKVRWFFLAGFLNGLGLTNHVMALLSVPAYTVRVLLW